MVLEGSKEVSLRLQTRADGILSGDYKVSVTFSSPQLSAAAATTATFTVIDAEAASGSATTLQMSVVSSSLQAAFATGNGSSLAVQLTETGRATLLVAPASQHLLPLAMYYTLEAADAVTTAAASSVAAPALSGVAADVASAAAAGSILQPALAASSLSFTVASSEDDFAVGDRVYRLRVIAVPQIPESLTSADFAPALLRQLSGQITLHVSDNDAGVAGVTLLTDADITSAAYTTFAATLTAAATGSGSASAVGVSWPAWLSQQTGSLHRASLALREGTVTAANALSGAASTLSSARVVTLGLTRRPVGAVSLRVSASASDVALFPIVVAEDGSMSLGAAVSSLTISIDAASYRFPAAASGAAAAAAAAAGHRFVIGTFDDDLAQGRRAVSVSVTVIDGPVGAGSSDSTSPLLLTPASAAQSVARTFTIEDNDEAGLLFAPVPSESAGTVSLTASVGGAEVTGVELLEATGAGALTPAAAFATGRAVSALRTSFTATVSLRSRPFALTSAQRERLANATAAGVAVAPVVDVRSPAGASVTLDALVPRLCTFSDGRRPMRPVLCASDADCTGVRTEWASVGGAAVPSDIASSFMSTGVCAAVPGFTISPARVTFTSANYNVPVAVTITTVLDDGDAIGAGSRRGTVAGGAVTRAFGASIAAAVAATGDNVLGVSNAGVAATAAAGSVPVLVHEANAAGAVVSYGLAADSSPITTLALAEGQSTSYSVALTSRPRGNVVIAPSAAQWATAGFTAVVTPSQLVFNESNYWMPQTVSVAVLNDFIDQGEGSIAVPMPHGLVLGGATTDPLYAALQAADLPRAVASITNDDVRAVRLQGPALTAVPNGTVTFVGVTLGTQPLAQVTVTVTAAIVGTTSTRIANLLGSRVDVFPPSLAPTGKLLRSAAGGAASDITSEVRPYLRSSVTLTFDASSWSKAKLVPIALPRDSVRAGDIIRLTYSVVSMDGRYSTLATQSLRLPGAAEATAVLAPIADKLPLTTEGATTPTTLTVTLPGEPATGAITATVAGVCSYRTGIVRSATVCFADADCPAQEAGVTGTCLRTQTIRIAPASGSVEPSTTATLTATAISETASSVTLNAIAIDDSQDEGGVHPAVIAFSRADGTVIGQVTMLVGDNDGAGLTVVGKPASGDWLVSENGTMTAVYTIALRTQPAADVEVLPNVVATTAAGGSYPVLFGFAGSRILFTRDTYSAPRTVVVKAIQNAARNTVSGRVGFSVRHAMSSQDASYFGTDLTTLDFVSLDDDAASYLMCQTPSRVIRVAGEAVPADAYVSQPSFCGSAVPASVTVNEGPAVQPMSIFLGLGAQPSTGVLSVTLTADHPIFASLVGTNIDAVTGVETPVYEFSASTTIAFFTDGDWTGFTTVLVGVANDNVDSGARAGRISIVTTSTAVAGFASAPEYAALAASTVGYSIVDDEQASVSVATVSIADSTAALRTQATAAAAAGAAVAPFIGAAQVREGSYVLLALRISCPPAAGRRALVEVSLNATASAVLTTPAAVVGRVDEATSDALSTAAAAGTAQTRTTVEFTATGSRTVLVAVLAPRNEVVNGDIATWITARVLADTTTAADPGFQASLARADRSVSSTQLTVVDTNEQRLLSSAFGLLGAAAAVSGGLLEDAVQALVPVGSAALSRLRVGASGSLTAAASAGFTPFTLPMLWRAPQVQSSVIGGSNITVPTVYLMNGGSGAVRSTIRFNVSLASRPQATRNVSAVAWSVVGAAAAARVAVSPSAALVQAGAFRTGAAFTVSADPAGTSAISPAAQVAELMFNSGADWTPARVRVVVFEGRALTGAVLAGETLPGPAGVGSSFTSTSAVAVPLSATRTAVEGRALVLPVVLSVEPASAVTVTVSIRTPAGTQSVVRASNAAGGVADGASTFTLQPFGPTGSAAPWNVAQEISVLMSDDDFASAAETAEVCFTHSSEWPAFASGTTCVRLQLQDNDVASFAGSTVPATLPPQVGYSESLPVIAEGSSSFVAVRIPTTLRAGLTLTAVVSNAGANGLSLSRAVIAVAAGAASAAVPFTAVDNSARDGSRLVNISITAVPAGAADAAYAAVRFTATVLVVDDDAVAGTPLDIVAAVPRTPSGAVPVREGDSVRLSVRLASRPSRSVSVRLASPEPFLRISPTDLIFDESNTAQGVTVTAVRDWTARPDILTGLPRRASTVYVAATLTSTDLAFNDMSATLTMSVHEGDAPAVVLSPRVTGLPLGEGAAASSYTARLTLASMPSGGTVGVRVSAAAVAASLPVGDAGITMEITEVATAKAVATLAFPATASAESSTVLSLSSLNWMSGYAIKVTANADAVADGSPVVEGLPANAIAITAAIVTGSTQAPEYQSLSGSSPAASSSFSVVTADAASTFAASWAAGAAPVGSIASPYTSGGRLVLCEDGTTCARTAVVTAAVPASAAAGTSFAFAVSGVDAAAGVSVSPASATLTAGTGDQSVAFTFSAVQDDIARTPLRSVAATLTVVASGGALSSSVTRSVPITLEVADDDVSRLVVTRINGTATSATAPLPRLQQASSASGLPPFISVFEGQATAAYGLSLSAQPQGDVTVTVRDGALLAVDSALATSSASTLTPASLSGTQTVVIRAASWSQPVPVTLTAPRDYVARTTEAVLGAVIHSVSQAAPEGVEPTFVFDSTSASPERMTVPALRVSAINTDVAGIAVSLSSVILSEAATPAVNAPARSAVVNVRLTSMPSGAVRLTAAFNRAALSVSGGDALTFSPSDWDANKAITITTIDNSIDEGSLNVAYEVKLSVDATATADAGYLQTRPASVAVSVVNDDVAGLVLRNSAGAAPASFAVSEASGFAGAIAYTVALASQPVAADGVSSATVTVSLLPAGGVCQNRTTRLVDYLSVCGAGVAECPAGTACVDLSTKIAIAPASVVFTSSTWRAAQAVSVWAIDDAIVEGAHAATLRHTVSAAASATTDAVYAAASTAGRLTTDVPVAITDNDFAGVKATAAGASADAPTRLALSEAPTSTIRSGVVSVRLSAQPRASVTIFPVFDAAQVSVQPTSVRIDASLWATAASFIVTAINDAVDEAKPHASAISFRLASTDALFDSAAAGATLSARVDAITASIMDDDFAGVSYAFVNRWSDPTAAAGAAPLFVRAAAGGTFDDAACAQLCASSRSLCISSGCLLFDEGDADALLFESGPSDRVAVVLTSKPSATVKVRVPGAVTSAAATSSLTVTNTRCLAASAEAVTPGSELSQLRAGTASGDAAELVFTPSNWNIPQYAALIARDDRLTEGTHTLSLAPILESTDGNYASAAALRATSCAASGAWAHPELASTYAAMLTATPARFRASGAAAGVCSGAVAPALKVRVREDALVSAPALSSARFTDDLASLDLAFSGPVDINYGTFSAVEAVNPALSDLLSFVRFVASGDEATASAEVCALSPTTDASVLLATTNDVLGTFGPLTAYRTSATTARLLLPSTNNVVVGSLIAAVTGTLRAQSSMSSLPVLGSGVAVQAPVTPVIPVPDLGQAASMSTCNPVSVSVALRGGGGGRAVTFAWSITAAADNDGNAVNVATLPASLATAIAAATAANAATLTLQPADVPNGYTIVLAVTATNFLGVSGTATKSLTKANEEGPELAAVEPSVSALTNEPVALSVRARAPACPGVELTAEERAMTFYWLDVTPDSPLDPYDTTSNASAALWDAAPLAPNANSGPVRFALPAGSTGVAFRTRQRYATIPAFLLAGGSYVFRVYAVRDQNPASFSFSDITVNVGVPSVVAVLAGGDPETTAFSDAVVLDASNSYDPSTETGVPSETTSYSWLCAPDASANAAVGISIMPLASATGACGFDTASASGAVLRYAPRFSGFVVGATYRFTASYKVGSRTATATKAIRIASARPLAVSANLLTSTIDVDGALPSLTIGSGARLQAAVVSAADLPEGMVPMYSWSQAAGPQISQALFTATASNALPLGARSATFAVEAAVLVPASTYRFCVNIVAGASGSACVDFRTPAVPILGDLTVRGTGANGAVVAFGAATVTLASVQAADPVTLVFRYVSGYASSAAAAAAASAINARPTAPVSGTVFEQRAASDLSFSSDVLPEGFAVVVVSATSNFGAASKAVPVTVTAFAGTADDLITRTTLEAASGDPTTTGALLDGTLSTLQTQTARRMLSAQQRVGGGRGRRLLTDENTINSAIALLNTTIGLKIRAKISAGTLSEADVMDTLASLSTLIDTLIAGRTAAGLPTAWLTAINAYITEILAGFTSAATFTGGPAAVAPTVLRIVTTLAAAPTFVFAPAAGRTAADATRIALATRLPWSGSSFSVSLADAGAVGQLAGSTAASLSGVLVTPASARLPTATFGTISVRDAAGSAIASSARVLAHLRSGADGGVAAPAAAVTDGTFTLSVYNAEDGAATPMSVRPVTSGATAVTFTLPGSLGTSVVSPNMLSVVYYNESLSRWVHSGVAVTSATGSSITVASTHLSSFALTSELPAGLVLSQSLLAVAEAAASPSHTATMTVKLTTAPDSDVTVTVALPSGVCVLDGAPIRSPAVTGPVVTCTDSCTDAGAVCVQLLATASPATLTFTSANFATAQTITVTAITDSVAEAAWSSNATLSLSAASSDPRFAALAASTATVMITDADSPSVVITPALPTRMWENDTETRTFALSLASKPLAGVTVAVAVADASADYGTVSPASLTFTTSDWSTGQTLLVTAKDDTAVNGDHSLTIDIDLDASTDPVYAARTEASRTITLTDNDVADVIITPTAARGTAVTELGGTFGFTVALGSRPSAAVTVSFTVSLALPAGAAADTGKLQVTVGGAVKVGPTYTVTLTETNYAAGVAVSVKAQNDGIASGDYNVSLPLAITTTATEYAAFTAAPRAAALSQPLFFRVQDVNSPAWDISLSDTTVAVGGSAVILSVALKSPPVQSVTVAVTVGNAASTGEGYPDAIVIDAGAATTSFTFSADGDDYKTPRQMSLGAPVSAFAFPRSDYSLKVAFVSGDAGYATLAAATRSLTLTGARTPGLVFDPASLSLKKASTDGASTQLSVSLAARPVNATTITLSQPTPANSAAPVLTFSPATITIASVDYAEAVKVTVSVVASDFATGTSSSTAAVKITAGDAYLRSAVATAAGLSGEAALQPTVSVPVTITDFATAAFAGVQSSVVTASGAVQTGVAATTISRELAGGIAFRFTTKPTTTLRVTASMTVPGRLRLVASDGSLLDGNALIFSPADWTAGATILMVWVPPTSGQRAAATVGVTLVAEPVDASLALPTDGFAAVGGVSSDAISFSVDSDDSMPSPIPTPSNTPSISVTGTKSSSETVSGTKTASGSITATKSATVTATGSGTVSTSLTATATASNSQTASGTATASKSGNGSAPPTPTATASSSTTASGTGSGTVTASGTRTNTGSVSITATNTVTASTTGSITATATGTRSTSPTGTRTASATRSNTATATASLSRGASPSHTASASGTTSGTQTASESSTVTQTASETRTETGTTSTTATETATASETTTSTGTRSGSASISASNTASRSVTATATASSGAEVLVSAVVQVGGVPLAQAGTTAFVTSLEDAMQTAIAARTRRLQGNDANADAQIAGGNSNSVSSVYSGVPLQRVVVIRITAVGSGAVLYVNPDAASYERYAAASKGARVLQAGTGSVTVKFALLAPSMSRATSIASVINTAPASLVTAFAAALQAADSVTFGSVSAVVMGSAQLALPVTPSPSRAPGGGSGSDVNVGAIVGGVVGGIAFLGLIVGMVAWRNGMCGQRRQSLGLGGGLGGGFGDHFEPADIFAETVAAHGGVVPSAATNATEAVAATAVDVDWTGATTATTAAAAKVASPAAVSPTSFGALALEDDPFAAAVGAQKRSSLPLPSLKAAPAAAVAVPATSSGRASPSLLKTTRPSTPPVAVQQQQPRPATPDLLDFTGFGAPRAAPSPTAASAVAQPQAVSVKTASSSPSVRSVGVTRPKTPPRPESPRISAIAPPVAMMISPTAAAAGAGVASPAAAGVPTISAALDLGLGGDASDAQSVTATAAAGGDVASAFAPELTVAAALSPAAGAAAAAANPFDEVDSDEDKAAAAAGADAGADAAEAEDVAVLVSVDAAAAAPAPGSA